MAKVLARDYAGKPLRVNDLVLVMPLPDIRDEFRNRKMTITGPVPIPILKRLSAFLRGKNPQVQLDNRYIASGESLRRIDFKPPAGNWQELANDTGWKPQPVEEEEKEPTA